MRKLEGAQNNIQNENENKGENQDIFDNEKDENYEISMNYIFSKKKWNRKRIIPNESFAYSVAIEIINDENDLEPILINECRKRPDWPRWKEAIEAELKSLEKREVFGQILQTPKGIKPVGFKWVFVRKRNEKNEIIRYKARLVAQGYSQMPGVDYEETYSPVVDATTLRFLVSLTVSQSLHM